MDLGLAGKKAVVMSSSRGLGAGIAHALAAEGADVVLTGRAEARLAAEVAEINAKGAGRASYVVADLADPATVEVLATAAAAMGGGGVQLIHPRCVNTPRHQHVYGDPVGRQIV